VYRNCDATNYINCQRKSLSVLPKILLSRGLKNLVCNCVSTVTHNFCWKGTKTCSTVKRWRDMFLQGYYHTPNKSNHKDPNLCERVISCVAWKGLNSLLSITPYFFSGWCQSVLNKRAQFTPIIQATKLIIWLRVSYRPSWRQPANGELIPFNISSIKGEVDFSSSATVINFRLR
jgi:hypothetical protein